MRVIALSLQPGKCCIASADLGLHSRAHREDRAEENNAHVCVRVNYLNRVAGEEELLSVHSGSRSVEDHHLGFPKVDLQVMCHRRPEVHPSVV